ncbi:hypothetical protein CDV36_006150 [Fusarium kuroshium]|uniref:Uncharacterized protein n=1 Tax=Fusarium kuroshium TaxID=2010991 RepID=A0A3M2SAD9_9HYPO|nr:hypothetical protein CDV36_006150 [Fusarium kuroshium]
MSMRQETCRASAAEPKSLDYLPQSLSESLHGMPLTSDEWSKAIADVKREYLNRRYRPCATRCCEILDNIKDSSVIEPAYLIYLHFYAASSLEMLARALNQGSATRTSLLHQARDHYQRASALINAADSAVGPALLRRPSGTTTTLPSLHSADSSVSSYASSTWTSSHGASPASSISSIQDTPRPKRKKRVTFSEMPIELLERPDSPTLGLGSLLGSVRSASPDPLDVDSPVMPAPLRPSAPLPRSCLTPRSAPAESVSYSDSELDPFRHARSVHRYSALLTSLQRQVFRHLTFIESELLETATQEAVPPSPVSVMVVHPVHPSIDAGRSPELQARIERLRAKGWERKRFNARRYEELRESAVADLVD